jgi:hypothetical protein
MAALSLTAAIRATRKTLDQSLLLFTSLPTGLSTAFPKAWNRGKTAGRRESRLIDVFDRRV